MTISSETSSVEHAGDGVTTTFPVPYIFYAKADLNPVILDETGEIDAGAFTATGMGAANGGSITLTTAPPSGTVLRIDRRPPFTQTTAYTDHDRFPAQSHERALDREVMLAQRVHLDQQQLEARSLRIRKGLDSNIDPIDPYEIEGRFLFGKEGGGVGGATGEDLLPLIDQAAIDAIDEEVANQIDQVVVDLNGQISAINVELDTKADEAAVAAALATKADGPATEARFVADEADIAALQANLGVGGFIELTYADLAAITPTFAGQIAYVAASDTGTHTDPITGETVDNSGEYRGSVAPATVGWQRVGDRTIPSAASLAEMLAGVLNTKMATPLNVEQLLAALYADFRAANFTRDGSALFLHDRKGRIGFEVKTDGTGWLGGKQIATVQNGAAALDPRSRMMITVDGGSLAIDDDAGDKPIGVVDPDIPEEDDEDEINYRTYLAAFQLQMTYDGTGAGLESYSASSNGTVTALGTSGFFPGGSRERSIVPVMRAMAYGPLAGSDLVVDLAGVLGTNGQLDLLSKGGAAFANRIQNISVARNEALADGKSFGIAAMFWRFDVDWHDAYTEDSYLSAYRQWDADDRTATAFVESAGYPRFIRQVDNHCLVTSDVQWKVVCAQGRFGEVQYSYVVGPSYQYSHVSGSSPGRVWADAALLDAHGKRHAGCMDAKAWRRYAETGAWRPCEIISARKLGPRQIEVSIWTPVPPLLSRSDIVAELADGCHGLEVWSPASRISLVSAEISYDGAITHIGKITINTATDLPASGAEVCSARSSDIAGTISGDYYEGRQPGPETGPRTTIHDSDGVDDGEPWFNQMRGPDNKPYDLSNYLTVKRVPVQ